MEEAVRAVVVESGEIVMETGAEDDAAKFVVAV